MRFAALLKWTGAAALSALLLLSAACGCNTPEGDEIGELLGEWYLSTDESLEPRLEHLVDVAEALREFDLEVEPLEGAAYRFGFVTENGGEVLDWIAEADANEAAYLEKIPLLTLAEEPVIVMSHAGIDDDSLLIEIVGSKAWLETLLDVDILSFAYPTHVHDRRIMEAVREADYRVARNGQITVEPWGSHLLGLPDDPAWNLGWQHTSPYELPLTFLASEIQALEASAIEDWLAEAERLPLWKSQHRWIQLYTRTDSQDQTSTEIIDADRLAVLLDALIDDGDVWIAPLGEVAAWALANGQAAAVGEDLLWEAAAPGAQPWNGHACAFSFSTDDGFRSNLTHYMPEFRQRELSYTAFCSPEKIQIGDTGYELLLDSEGVQELADEGIEIGCNGMSRRYLLPREVFELADPTGETHYIEIVVENGKKLLRLWRDW